jgi:hypothetical protein
VLVLQTDSYHPIWVTLARAEGGTIASAGLRCRRFLPTVVAMAAIFNLNHPAHYVHWHFIDVSVPNIIVIVLMLVVFAAAILVPFPKHGRSGTES